MVIMAAGKAMNRFILNLSFSSQPKDCVAAIVVSEIIERLSPNIEPPNKAPAISGNDAPLDLARLTAIGPMATIAPTEVPVAVDKKAAIRKMPKGKYATSMVLM